MTSSFDHVSVISLFVEDLQAATDFYSSVFRVPVVFEDATSVALRLDNLIVNLLQTDSAGEIIEPLSVGTRESGPRFQLSIWVHDRRCCSASGSTFRGPMRRLVARQARR